MRHPHYIPTLVLAALAPASIVVAADYLSLDAAQKAVYPEADAFQEWVVKQTPEQINALLAQAGPQPPHGTIRIFKATRNGTLLGHVFVDEVIGRENLITYAVGIDADGALRNLEIMSYRESHGGEIRNPAWRAQFDQPRLARPAEISYGHQEYLRGDALLGARHPGRAMAAGALAGHAAPGGRRDLAVHEGRWHRRRMPRRQRAVVYVIVGALWISGCAWLWLDQFAAQRGPFGSTPHPLQPRRCSCCTA